MEQDHRNLLDCNYIKFKNPSDVIQKIISLIQEQVTENDFQRQKEYIDQLVSICSMGFVSFSQKIRIVLL